MQGNWTGMLAEIDISAQIDPEFCDVSFQYGTYYAAVRCLLVMQCHMCVFVNKVLWLQCSGPRIRTSCWLPSTSRSV